MLLPALGSARAKAKNAACMTQLRQIGGALASYADDNDTRLPWVNSNANPSTCQTVPFGARSGFGYLVAGNYTGHQQILFCPDAVVFDGWGGVAGGNQSRLRYMRTLPADVAANTDDRVDYALGWWDGAPSVQQFESGAGFGRAAGGRRTLYWLADDYAIFAYYYRVLNHKGLYMNMGRTDGGVETIIDWRRKQPTAGDPGYYYPYNDRPGWGFWRYFGTGLGMR